MTARKPRPTCYACDVRLARDGSLFCTQRCAAEWADQLAAGNGDFYCAQTGVWEHTEFGTCLGCSRPSTSSGHVDGQARVFGTEPTGKDGRR